MYFPYIVHGIAFERLEEGEQNHILDVHHYRRLWSRSMIHLVKYCIMLKCDKLQYNSFRLYRIYTPAALKIIEDSNIGSNKGKHYQGQ